MRLVRITSWYRKKSMEAILACYQLSTEWLDWVAILCELLPWPKKRTIIEIRGEKNAVPRVISCSIRRDQRRASPIRDCPRLLPCADRAWSSLISHVEQRSTRRESRGWFFFLARVVWRICTGSILFWCWLKRYSTCKNNFIPSSINWFWSVKTLPKFCTSSLCIVCTIMLACLWFVATKCFFFFFFYLFISVSQRPDLSRRFWTSEFHLFLFVVFSFLAFQWSKQIAQFAQAAIFAGMWSWWLLCLCFFLSSFFCVLPLWLSMLLLIILKNFLQICRVVLKLSLLIWFW